ncbi:DUF6338 family protein [Microbacterium maritypicum]|uniref:DUF6338 family protein n=1 Tax=Microbacterium maritypicum TaxID=33918 RepID=UPI003A90F8D9
MGVPEGSFAVAAFIVIALPGFIYAWIRRWLRGESAADRNVGLAIARGAAFAVTLTALYLALFGDLVATGIKTVSGSDALALSDPQVVGLTVLVLYVIVPTAVSALLQVRHIAWQKVVLPERAPEWLRTVAAGVRWPRSKHGYSPVPTAWDYAVTQNQSAYVKVKRGSTSEWIGGWYTGDAFAAMYPEPRSIYIHQQYAMNKKGEFGDPLPDSSVFLMINDDDVVYWSRVPVLPSDEDR